MPPISEMTRVMYKRIHFLMTFKFFFFEICLPKTKPITGGIVYRLRNQTNFINTLTENFVKIGTSNKEIEFRRF